MNFKTVFVCGAMFFDHRCFPNISMFSNELHNNHISSVNHSLVCSLHDKCLPFLNQPKINYVEI